MSNEFSVLMAVYYGDKPEWLNEALKSIEKQTLLPSEVILVQDGNIDNDLLEIINHYKSRFTIKHIILNENRGLSIALNKGLKSCQYDLIARVDSDDINSLDRFEIQINNMLENKHISALGTWISEFINDPNEKVSIRKVPLLPKEILQFSKYRSPMNHPSVVFRKKDILEVGGYNENLINRQDHDLWVKLIQNNKVITNVSSVLVNARISKDFYKRRMGFSQFKIDYKLSKSFLESGYIKKYEYYLIIILKLIFRITPKFIATLYYKIFFR